jgi:ParB family chromosome partitioning protein
MEKKSLGDNQHTMRVGKNCPPLSTSKKLADEYNVGERTIKNDATFTNAVDEIENAVPGTKSHILSKNLGLSKKDVVALARVAKENPEKAKEILSSGKKPHVSRNTGKNEWYTPDEYIDAVCKVLGTIDCDPASSEIANRTVRARTFFTIDDDGLKQKWSGKVFMNPPYNSKLITKFCSKLVKDFVSNDVTDFIVIVNNATETKWFRELVSVASAICFPSGRIKFKDQNGDNIGAPLQGQAVLYAGDNHELFLGVFSEFGWGAEIWK